MELSPHLPPCSLSDGSHYPAPHLLGGCVLRCLREETVLGFGPGGWESPTDIRTGELGPGAK